MGYIPGYEEYQGDQQDQTDTKEEEGESAPQSDFVFHPVQILLMGGLQLGDLGNVLAFGICQLLLDCIQIGFVLGGSEFGCGYLQIGCCHLLPDFGGIGGAAMLTEGYSLLLGNQREQRIVDGCDRDPFIIAGSGAEIFICGGLTDYVPDKRINVFQIEAVFLFDGLVICPFFLSTAQGCQVNTPAGGDKVGTGEAFGIKWGGILQKWGQILTFAG